RCFFSLYSHRDRLRLHSFPTRRSSDLDDPLNRELNLVSVLPQPLYGIVEQPGAFWNFGDIPVIFKRCCPDIGEHSDEIMRDIGYSDDEIAAYREQKVIG